MIDEKKENSQETASKPAPDWVKNKMTVSLSAANLKEVQAYVAGLPESEGVDNVSKLLLHLLLLAETSGDLCNLAVENAQREIQEFILELQTELETSKENTRLVSRSNEELVSQHHKLVHQIEELKRQVAETSKPVEKNELETSSKPTVKSWFWQENLK